MTGVEIDEDCQGMKRLLLRAYPLHSGSLHLTETQRQMERRKLQVMLGRLVSREPAPGPERGACLALWLVLSWKQDKP